MTTIDSTLKSCARKLDEKGMSMKLIYKSDIQSGIYTITIYMKTGEYVTRMKDSSIESLLDKLQETIKTL